MKTSELKRFVQDKKMRNNGKDISYQTICEDYPVLTDDGALIGTMFTYSYIRTDVEDRSNRPVLFAYNGGPGSSALWLHTGLLAPKRVQLENPVEPRTVPPFILEDNPNCFLDICDIVIIDPMGTGYSKVFDTEKQNEVYSVEKDAKIFADYIQYWTSKYKRWSSAKYLLGESYGTLRSCIIPTILLGGPLSEGAQSTGISIDGIIMLGTGINVNPTPNYWDEYGVERMALDLPTMAACNWYYHGGNKQKLEVFLNEAYAFTENECLNYLYKGYKLTEIEKEDFLEKLTYFTGLSREFLIKHNYRVSLSEFSKELLADKALEIGMYDGRFCLPFSNQIGMQDPVADDCAMGQYTPAFRGAFIEMAERELGIQMDRPYSIINFNVNGMWKYDGVKTPFQYLQAGLRRNPEMKILVCNGIYDLVTTIGQARYTVNHLHFREGQIIIKEYPSGHMAYVGERSGALLGHDIRAFIQKEEMKSCY